jgi:hypothetical protein
MACRTDGKFHITKEATTNINGIFIDTSGQLGINNNSPISTLSLGNASIANTDGSLSIARNNATGGVRQFKMCYDGLFYECLGDFGNNNVAGTFVRHIRIAYNCPEGTIIALFNGDVYAYNEFRNYSDIKFKTNITTIENALWKVQQLRGVEYNHIIEGDRKIGLIAQEVEHILPEIVKETPEGTKTLAYGSMVAVLINAIKEQQEIIDNQQNQINNIMDILSRNNIK